MKPKETNLDEILIQYAPELTDTEHIKLRTVLERHVQVAIQEFIAKETIVEKFETLAEYIPKPFQPGYIEGMREEVDDFIAYLQPKPIKEAE